MTFPLFRRPGTIVVVDDDELFLDMLKLLLPVHWNVLLYLSPTPVIAHITSNAHLCEQDASQHQKIIVDSVSHEIPLIEGILKYWASSPDRYAIVNTVVTDYFMPAMDGLAMLKRLDGWQGTRVLLTGQADEHVAVKAFNEGLIDQYISKGGTELSRRVIDAIRVLSARAHPRYEHIWRGLLSPNQIAALQDDAVAKDLQTFVDSRWVEYMVVDRPFGILGLSNVGVPGWLQLETPATLSEAADIGLDRGLDEGTADAIRAGHKLHALELRGVDKHKLVAPAVRFGGENPLLGALFEAWPALPGGGYAQWRARQPVRAIIV